MSLRSLTIVAMSGNAMLLNLPSRRAAERLGFVYEGTFRQAVVYKGGVRGIRIGCL